MHRILFLLFFASSLSYAVTYQTVTMDAVKSSGNVWTVAGTMDTSGVVRTTGRVAVSGTSRSLAVSASADMFAARLALKAAARFMGPVALALVAYDIYTWLSDNSIKGVDGEWAYLDGDIAIDADSVYGLVSCPYLSVHDGTLADCVASHKKVYPRATPTGSVMLDPSHSVNPECTADACVYYFNQDFTNDKDLSFYIYWNSLNTKPYQGSRSATGTDWDSLPDMPIPLVAAGYNNIPSLQTSGVPIVADSFTFAPFSDWTSEPYFKNGQWYRDKVDVSACPTASNPLRVCVTSSTVNSSSESTDTATVPDDLKTPDAGGTTGTETTDFCKLNPKSIACSEMDEPEDPDLEVEQLPVNPDYSAWAGNAVCPAAVSFVDPGGYEKSLSFQPTCDFLAMMKPILICVGFCIAAFILFGSFRTTEG